MTSEKLTAKRVLTVVVCSALASVGIGLLYLGIIIFSLPFTVDMTVSWILSLSVTLGIILLTLAHTLWKKRRRGTKK